MRIAYIIFNDITWLDFIGIYDPLSRLRSKNFIPGLEWDICSYTNLSSDSFGLTIAPTKVNQPLQGYDALIIPGGYGTRNLISDESFLNWIRTGKDTRYKISICTGALILGAAGFLTGKTATTHFDEYETLKQYCGHVSRERIVEDGNIITAGAVSSSLDLGLYLCNKWAGPEAAKEVRRRMDYQG